MKIFRIRSVAIVGAVFCLALIGSRLTIVSQNRRTKTVQQDTSTPEGMLALANFYHQNNDTSDAADRYYRQVISRYPDTRSAGLAQFNRGAYWHGKYNILREQKKEDQSALVEAEGQYYDFIDKFANRTGTVDLLSDARFNLALVYLQKGNRANSVGWLNVLISKASEDGEIYVYRVVWSSNASDVIDRKFRSNELALFGRDVIQRGDLSTDQIISQIKQWCRKH
jgi:tetratricopeptide repeat protein